MPPASVTLSAGLEPGGYCRLAGAYPLGSTVQVHETIPPGDGVTGITVAPPARQVGDPNLGTGTVRVRIGRGMTEASYTDPNRQTGYLEICKQVIPSSTRPGGPFQFTVGSQTVPVPAGAYSPALQVPAGTHTLTETGGTIYACSTAPPSALLSCHFTAKTATVTVPVGNVSTETILTITNGPPGGGLATGGSSTGASQRFG